MCQQQDTMPLSVCVPYAWYLVVTCKKCGNRQPIHRDPSRGQSVLLRNYDWRCTECQYVEVYEPAEIERYQHIVERRKNPRA
jgi:predicted nucleic-acid-binding Zn-ribbon protein